MSKYRSWARGFAIGLLGRAGALLHGLRRNGEHPSRWEIGDCLISDDGSLWEVVTPPELADNITVNRIWENGIIYDVVAGHSYPPDAPLWDRFRKIK
jgi:hypothetical protein